MRDDSDPLAPKYEAEPVVCLACAERSSAARTATQDNEGKGMDGWYWLVRERTNGH